MKKSIALMFVINLSITLLTGCVSGERAQPAATPAVTPAAAPSDEPAPSPAKTALSIDEARAILQTWADSHPFQLGSEIEPKSDDHFIDGKEYYRFYLGIIRLGVAEILVDKETGELFHLTSPYATVGFAPIDEWYAKDHAG